VNIGIPKNRNLVKGLASLAATISINGSPIGINRTKARSPRIKKQS